jgi:hypothetical protein
MSAPMAAAGIYGFGSGISGSRAMGVVIRLIVGCLRP